MTSVAWTRPPVSRQIRKLSMVPQASWPASARLRSAGVLVEQPAELGGGEVRVEHQAGALADPGFVGLALAAEVGGAAVLPDDGPGDGPAGGAVPQHAGFALVGQADGGQLSRPRCRPPASAARHDRRRPTARFPRRRARPSRAADSAASSLRAHCRRARGRPRRRRRPACWSCPDRWPGRE